MATRPPACVGPGQCPAAEPSVDTHASRDHHIGVDRTLPVAQLTDVEIALHAVEPVDLIPAEKDVTPAGTRGVVQSASRPSLGEAGDGHSRIYTDT